MTRDEYAANMFGRNLCLARQRHGLSQERLAERTGLCRDTIYKIEVGQRSPRLDTLLVLADSLQIDVAELLKGLRASDIGGYGR
jgi:transcriptional regulator with XRE-family HTH domain